MQTTNNKHNQEQDKTAEDLLGVLVAIVIALAIALGLGAQAASFLASGSLLPGIPEDIGVILWNTVTENRGDPAMAWPCLLYTSPSPRDATLSRMPSSA